MITKQEMLETVKKQLAIDYNCNADDFDKDGVIITKAVKLEGRRKVPFLKTRCQWEAVSLLMLLIMFLIL